MAIPGAENKYSELQMTVEYVRDISYWKRNAGTMSRRYNDYSRRLGGV